MLDLLPLPFSALFFTLEMMSIILKIPSAVISLDWIILYFQSQISHICGSKKDLRAHPMVDGQSSHVSFLVSSHGPK